MQRESFLFYRSFAAIQSLPLKERDCLIWALINYALDGKEPDWDKAPNKVMAQVLWNSWKPILDANTRKYLAGKKGGAPAGNNNNPNGRKGNQELTNKQPGINQEPTNNQTNIKEKDKEKVKDKENRNANAFPEIEKGELFPKEDMAPEYDITPKEIFDMWNATAKERGGILPSMIQYNEARRRKIKARMAEFSQVPDMTVRGVYLLLLKKIYESQLLRGEKTGWRADFDWLFKDSNNWDKVLNGKYDDRTANASADGYDRLHITATSTEDYERDF